MPAEAGGKRPQPRNQLCLTARDTIATAVGCFSLRDIRRGRAEMSIIPGPRKTPAQLARLEATRQALQRRHPEWTLPRFRQPTGKPRRSGLAPDGVAVVRLGSGLTAPTAKVHDNFFEFVGREARRRARLHLLDAPGNVVALGPAVR